MVTARTAADYVTLTPESMEGPYYLDYKLVRRDITEGYPGVPLTLRATVIDTKKRVPIPNAALDVWQCNALGEYSGYTSMGIGGAKGSGAGTTPTSSPTATPSATPIRAPGSHVNPTDEKTFLRGVQLTDHQGVVTFQTIYPGWYVDRAIHIHVKVHIGGKVTQAGKYTGGHVSHTGQLYFPEAATEEVIKLEPYKVNTVARVKNQNDRIFTQGKGSGLLTLRSLRHGHLEPSLAHGLVATITLGIDPSATPAPAPVPPLPGS